MAPALQLRRSAQYVTSLSIKWFKCITWKNISWHNYLL